MPSEKIRRYSEIRAGLNKLKEGTDLDIILYSYWVSKVIEEIDTVDKSLSEKKKNGHEERTSDVVYFASAVLTGLLFLQNELLEDSTYTQNWLKKREQKEVSEMLFEMQTELKKLINYVNENLVFVYLQIFRNEKVARRAAFDSTYRNRLAKAPLN